MEKAIAEMTGARQQAHDESRRRLGITREIVSLQTTPAGDYAVVCLEGDDPAGIVAKYLHADAPFDRWFAERHAPSRPRTPVPGRAGGGGRGERRGENAVEILIPLCMSMSLPTCNGFKKG